MAEVKFHKVSSMPGGSLDSNAFYLVLDGSFAEMYVTDSSGVAKGVGNTAMIEAVVAALGGLAQIQLVADITARDALTLDSNALVLVNDATGDGTVTAGAALYFYDSIGDDWIKVAEYESMDFTVTWSSITGKPSSSTADIDDAVTKKHSHSNLSVLNGLSDSSGVLQYSGNPVDARKIDWSTLNW